jgi:enoyl-CoA hydratase/carnithine racemase
MTVRSEKRDRILIITIDRQEVRNALDLETNRDLARAWTEFRDDPELWAAIITGAGDKAFSAGADLKGIGAYYRSLSPTERRHLSETQPAIGGITRNLDIFKPIIAAINGHCLAGGLEIALTADIRIASENATFGLTETKWGIMPGAGGTQRLPRVVGVANALEMILTAKRIDAREALRIGLVGEVVPQDRLMPRAIETAEKICENGPLAVRAAKEAILRGMDMNLAEGLRLEQFLAEPLRSTEDAVEGPTAFVQKRRPEFKGK